MTNKPKMQFVRERLKVKGCGIQNGGDTMQ